MMLHSMMDEKSASSYHIFYSCIYSSTWVFWSDDSRTIPTFTCKNLNHRTSRKETSFMKPEQNQSWNEKRDRAATRPTQRTPYTDRRTRDWRTREQRTRHGRYERILKAPNGNQIALTKIAGGGEINRGLEPERTQPKTTRGEAAWRLPPRDETDTQAKSEPKAEESRNTEREVSTWARYARKNCRVPNQKLHEFASGKLRAGNEHLSGKHELHLPGKRGSWR
jgi:hypothetical protein